MTERTLKATISRAGWNYTAFAGGRSEAMEVLWSAVKRHNPDASFTVFYRDAYVTEVQAGSSIDGTAYRRRAKRNN